MSSVGSDGRYRGRSSVRLLASPVLTSILIWSTFFLHVTSFLQPILSPSISTLTARTLALSNQVLECFQLAPPVTKPEDASCSQVLMVYSFGNSYGQPFIGQYQPPQCDFNRVTLNFTVTSSGRQFDRLALMYLNDTEIFRTSTAEPTATGIIWTYEKDVSNYLSLWQQPQKIIFDLGNLINEIYTGPFNTTLTATFFTVDDSPQAADVILPISAKRSSDNAPSAFNVPEQNATVSLTLPQNIDRAIFSISAVGQSAEEFWWSNVLSSDTDTFNGTTTLYGYSPFREVQLYIDGYLAGVAWPFPVIFTGGIVPAFWRPIVGIDAFDLREDEIDVTAFLPLLCDGKEHVFDIRVAGLQDDGKGAATLVAPVGNYWVVTGKLFLWLDADGIVTTGALPTISSPLPDISVSSSIGRDANGTNTTLDYQVDVSRSFSVSGEVVISSGTRSASWSSDLRYSNTGKYQDRGNINIVVQSTSGSDESSSGYSREFEYPLSVDSTYTQFPDNGNVTITASMDRGKSTQVAESAAFPQDQGSLTTRQNGTATYYSIPAESRSAGFGSTEQKLSFSDAETGRAYRRHVLAVNQTIVFDEEGNADQGSFTQNVGVPAQEGDFAFAPKGAKAMLGRGPAQ